MTDAEISRRLALAIGWEEDQNDPDVILEFDCKDLDQTAHCKVWFDGSWRKFDYCDPAVIWPIAERYNKFPYALRDKAGELTGQWNAWVSDGEDVQADTAAKAVALAVIKAHKGAKE